MVFVTTSLLRYSMRSEFPPLLESWPDNLKLSRKARCVAVMNLPAAMRQVDLTFHVRLCSRKKLDGRFASCFLNLRFVHPKKLLHTNLFINPLRFIYIFVTAAHTVALESFCVDCYFERRWNQLEALLELRQLHQIVRLVRLQWSEGVIAVGQDGRFGSVFGLCTHRHILLKSDCLWATR